MPLRHQEEGIIRKTVFQEGCTSTCVHAHIPPPPPQPPPTIIFSLLLGYNFALFAETEEEKDLPETVSLSPVVHIFLLLKGHWREMLLGRLTAKWSADLLWQ